MLPSWLKSNNHADLKGLKYVNESFDNICSPKNSTQYVVSKKVLDFEGNFHFCNKIGSMAVISSLETALDVNITLQSYGVTSTYVFTGHTDIKVEGEWVLHNTSDKMSWQNWNSGEPNNLGGNEDCAVMIQDTLKINDDSCHKPFVSICKIAEVVYYLFIVLLHDFHIYCLS